MKSTRKELVDVCDKLTKNLKQTSATLQTKTEQVKASDLKYDKCWHDVEYIKKIVVNREARIRVLEKENEKLHKLVMMGDDYQDCLPDVWDQM
tara:strand:+ start:4300 stop:4578 length:279 start_codon:yes stop_codon:yes gene_type:complete